MNQPKKTPGLADNIDRVKARNSVDLDPRNIISSEWQELTFSVQDVPRFDAVAIKIVMTNPNPALSPLIDDIRIIGSE